MRILFLYETRIIEIKYLFENISFSFCYNSNYNDELQRIDEKYILNV